MKQVIREKVDLGRLMDRAFELSQYHAKRKRFQSENSSNHIKRGIGFASFLHGAGFTGSGEEYLASEVAAECTPEGKVRIRAASTEMGQGTNTIFSQIAADALGPENVTGVGMPGPYSSQGSIDDARCLASNLGIRFELLSINDVVESYRKSLKEVFRVAETQVFSH